MNSLFSHDTFYALFIDFDIWTIFVIIGIQAEIEFE